MGLALSAGTTVAVAPQPVYAAEAADGFSDVPKDHWAYEALDYLAGEGIIEGYGDGTFRGGRAMTRYEMASIVAKATQKGGGSLGGEAVLEKLQREFKQEMRTLKKQVAQNTKDIAEIKKEQERVRLHGFVRASYDHDTDRNKGDYYDDEKTNSRFYLNLLADLKINDEWTGHLQSETNQRYAHSTAVGSEGRLRREDGTIQRVWLSGKLKNGLEINMGRKWSSLGNQFSLLGTTTNGIDATYPVTKNGLRAGAFYYAMAEYPEADFSFWGPMVKGPIGHNFDIFLAYAKLNKGKDTPLVTPWVEGDYSHGNWIGSRAFVVSAATNILPNVRATVDYVRTNHTNDIPVSDPAADYGDNNQAWFARLDYKWTNPSVVGSFGAYLRYHNIGRNGVIFNDDAWSSVLRNSRGWTVGFKYVPCKNVEWETFYEIAKCNMDPYPWSGKTYTRRLLRTQLDYHF